MGGTQDKYTCIFEPYWKVTGVHQMTGIGTLYDPKGKAQQHGDADKLQKIADARNVALGLDVNYPHAPTKEPT